MKKYFLSFLVLLCSLSFSAFANGQLKGRVFNLKNNEAIPFATVVISETTKGTVTDDQGNFTLENLDPGFYKLKITAVGYKTYFTESFRITLATGATISAPMEEDNVKLDEVVIRPSSFRKKEESPVSLRTIGIEEIEKSPGSNRDISKVIQSFPGVASSSAFRNDIIVRGGGPSENKFYLDGVEIPNVNHFATQGASGGPVGIINVDFLREVNFYSGAFPSSRGNALSSVLEFNQREANEKLKFRGTLGASDLALALEGPLSKNTTFMASVRRSYLQFLFQAIGLPFLPTYNDFQFKVKTKLNAKTELSFIGLGALDQSKLNLTANKTEEQRYILGYLPENNQWNYTLGVVLKHFTDRGNDTYVLSQNKLNNSALKYQDNVVLPSKLNLDYNSYELETKFRYEHNYRSSSDFKINYGVDMQHASYYNHTYRKSFDLNMPYTISYQSNLSFNKYAAFGQISHAYLDQLLNLSFGLRADGANYSSAMANPLKNISPRLSASLRLTPGTSLNFNVGQFAQLPSYTTLGYRDASGSLVNQANGLAYIHVNHYVAGVEFRPSDNSQITVEGFYKRYTNYPFCVKDSVSLASKGADYGVYGDEAVTSTSNGRAYGFEVLGRLKRYKQLNAIATYTFVRSEFTDKNGEFLPSSWDNRHLLTITATRNLKKNWDLGFKWRYLGGAPYTPWDLNRSAIKTAWDAQGAGYLDYSRFNKSRLNAYHQLDVRVDKSWYYNKWSLMLYFDIQNAYNFKSDQPDYLVRVEDASGNPMTDPQNSSKYLLRSIKNTGGTVLPTIGVMIEF
ncbi:MAG: TonB-dependent receptor [Bacteroidia bacterium]|nr:TonB-dependent receptor [Bacteroidia bacterium]